MFINRHKDIFFVPLQFILPVIYMNTNYLTYLKMLTESDYASFQY